MTRKFILVQLTGLALLTFATLSGITYPIFQSDTTFMAHGLVLLFSLGLFFAYRGQWDHVFRTSRFLVGIGLLGTVIGFKMALSGVSPDSAGSIEAIKPMVAGLVKGMGTALSTTIVGLIGSLWLRMTSWIIR